MYARRIYEVREGKEFSKKAEEGKWGTGELSPSSPAFFFDTPVYACNAKNCLNITASSRVPECYITYFVVFSRYLITSLNSTYQKLLVWPTGPTRPMGKRRQRGVGEPLKINAKLQNQITKLPNQTLIQNRWVLPNNNKVCLFMSFMNISRELIHCARTQIFFKCRKIAIPLTAEA